MEINCLDNQSGLIQTLNGDTSDDFNERVLVLHLPDSSGYPSAVIVNVLRSRRPSYQMNEQWRVVFLNLKFHLPCEQLIDMVPIFRQINFFIRSYVIVWGLSHTTYRGPIRSADPSIIDRAVRQTVNPFVSSA